MKAGVRARKNKYFQKAQVSLETALALVVLALFVAGGMAVFNAMNQ